MRVIFFLFLERKLGVCVDLEIDRDRVEDERVRGYSIENGMS